MSLAVIKPGSLAADYYAISGRIKKMLLGENVHNRKVAAVGRYLSTGPKGVTRKEVEWCHENEIGVHFIYEEEAQEILGGASRGARSARNALALINKNFKDYPAGAPIVACADTQVTTANIKVALEYMGAFQKVLKADGRYVMAGYADTTLASRFQFSFVTIPGAPAWSRKLHTAVKGIDRFDVTAMRAAFAVAEAPKVTMLQKLDASKLVDWLFVYEELPVWLPDATPVPLDDFFLILRKGSSGYPVRVLQALLMAKGHTLLFDGAFGPQTERAVKTFQRISKITVDGIVGDSTWKALLS